MQRQFTRALGTALIILFAKSQSLAEVRSDAAAALLTFPHLEVDSSRGIDTAIRLVNAGAEAVDVACFLENVTGHCVAAPATTCTYDAECADGDRCDRFHHAVTRFDITLTGKQPLGWSVSGGRATLPLAGNSGAIPPVPEDPFAGALRCVALDADGTPSDRNVLQGTATVERYDAGIGLLDAAAYNAVGQAAHAGAVNDDGVLTLGGPAGEYEGCPAVLTMNHFFDLAVDPMRSGSTLLTELTLVGCGGSLWRPGSQPGHGAVAQFFVMNEFEQRLSTSLAFATQLVSRLSAIDTSDATRSIFSAGVQGTLSGQTQIIGVPLAGIMGVALERHQDVSAPERVSSAAFNLHSAGEGEFADSLVTKLACEPQPLAGCRSARASSLRLRQGLRSRITEIAWQWTKGQATSAAELGDPLHRTEYALCLYAGGDSAARAVLRVPPSSTRWTSSKRGLTYIDPTGAGDGVLKIALRSSTADRAAAELRARGNAVPPLGLSDGLPTPVIVQLLNSDGTCLQSTFEADDVRENGQGIFKGRARR